MLHICRRLDMMFLVTGEAGSRVFTIVPNSGCKVDVRTAPGPGPHDTLKPKTCAGGAKFDLTTCRCATNSVVVDSHTCRS